MGRHPRKVTLISVEQLTWMEDEGIARVIDTANDPELGFGLVVLTPSGDHRFMSPVEVVRAAGIAMGMSETARQWFDDQKAWDGVPDRVKFKAMMRAQDLAEMITGDPHGDVLTGRARPENVNPQYDPTSVSAEERVKRKVAELKRSGEKGASKTQLYEQLGRLRQPGGVRNLVDQRYGRPKADQLADPLLPLRLDVAAFAESRADSNTITQKNFHMAYRASKSTQFLSGFADGDVKRLADEAYRRHGLSRAATTRRSQETRDQRHLGFWNVTHPYECIQIDSTPIDALAVDQYGRITKQVNLLTAVDVFNSAVRAFALVEGKKKMTTQVVKRLLWDTVANNYFGDGPNANPLGAAPMLCRRVQVCVIDRGGEFNAFATLGLTVGIETHTVIAPPGMGIRKPHVEAGYRVAALFAQLLPGAKGANVRERGREPEKKLMLRVDHLSQIVGALLSLDAHVPHADGRWQPDYPGVRLSPAQIEEQYFRTNGAIELDPLPHRALELLEVKRASLGNNTISVNSRTYSSHALRDIAEQLPWTSQRAPRIAVYVDRARPEAVIVRGTDGLPCVIPQVDGRRPTPVLGDILDRDLREQLTGGPLPIKQVEELKEEIFRISNSLAVRPGEPAKPPAIPQGSAKSGSASISDLVARYEQTLGTTEPGGNSE